jgi:tetrapyrrole methylase family protein / MazG family protein
MKQYSFDEFMDIIRQLRSENGCPWDKEQTHESLKTCLIEECYEVIEAINNKDVKNLREELGDILLQVALHTAIAEEKMEFDIQGVINEVSEKMIRRHPHVFGDKVAMDSTQVLGNWEEIKKQEKKEKNVSESIIKVPKALPANIRAEKVQKKAAKVGLEFDDFDQALEKVYEGIEELKKARKVVDFDDISEEYGDLMFYVVNLSTFLQLNAENSLTNATDKFINRFVGTERIAMAEGKRFDQLSIEELKALWGRIKAEE